MLSKVKSYGLHGINGYPIDIEIDIGNGLPCIEMVGLPDAATKESKERVKSAIKNSGYLFSPNKITINLAPADTKKEGSIFDLGIALGILMATEQIPIIDLRDTIFLGELSLDGSLRHINGVMPIVIAAKEQGFRRIILPLQNAREASFVEGIDIFAFGSLQEVVLHLTTTPKQKIEHSSYLDKTVEEKFPQDFKYVKGQYTAKRALEIACSGGHNILMIGPPGAGKTMLARCLPSILPAMTMQEVMETTKIHSVAGVLDFDEGIVTKRPFRAPHHTASRIALTGGSGNAKPGEISLAHNGVLFLDELLEYPRATLEILRQPLEDHTINISRALRTVEYPANFMLVASMNPCPCGNYGSQLRECKCTPAQISKYMARLSGPLLDRIDLHIEVDDVTYDDLSSTVESECSLDIKKRVNEARNIQNDRYNGCDTTCNALLSSEDVKRYCKLDSDGESLLKEVFQKFSLSARAYTRILKVSRTIADMENCKDIASRHIAEAIQYRTLDRKYWL